MEQPPEEPKKEYSQEPSTPSEVVPSTSKDVDAKSSLGGGTDVDEYDKIVSKFVKDKEKKPSISHSLKDKLQGKLKVPERKSAEEYKEILKEKSKQIVPFLKNRYLNKQYLKKYIPYSLGYFFIFLGLSSTLGTTFTNIFLPGFSYQDIGWFYLFIGVDLVGCFALPLLLIHLKVIRPFFKYGTIYENLFVCKDVSLFEIMNINFYLPCATQTLIFYLWLFSVLVLFMMRYPPLDKPIFFLGKITFNYFYIFLLIVKVSALSIIFASSTPLGIFTSAGLAIGIILVDFITLNIAIKKKQKQPKQNI